MPTQPRPTAAPDRPAAPAPLLAWSAERAAQQDAAGQQDAAAGHTSGSLSGPGFGSGSGTTPAVATATAAVLAAVWQDTLRRLRHVTARSVVTTWLSRLQLLRIVGSDAWLAAPDEATAELVSQHYLDLLAAALGAAWHEASAAGQNAAAEPANASTDYDHHRDHDHNSGHDHNRDDELDAPLAALRLHLQVGLPAPTAADPGFAARVAPSTPGHDLPLVAAPATASADVRRHDGAASRAAAGGVAGPALLWPSQDGSWPGATGQLQPSLLPEGASYTPRDEADLLSARLTFGSFVVGSSNELAASAARAVALAPGQQYNPLFIHGGVGLGKTHLLHAIGHLARERNPNLRVRYVAAETYIDDNLSAWRSKDGSARNDVRNLYRRDVDLLLVDDIQFLEGREKVQEEFFHLFNALHQTGKQIVLTGDRFPAELTQLHDRLRSRFEWGLVAEVLPPDRNLRLAILRQNAERLAMPLPHDVAFYLADHLRNNVRELEGALTKLSAHAKIGKRTVDLPLARSVLGPLLELPARNLSAEVIQRVTAQQFGLKVTDLKGERRHRAVVVPRMVAMYLARKHTQLSFPEIGRAFGGRDHSTVIHACQKIEWLLATDKDTQSSVQAIESALGK